MQQKVFWIGICLIVASLVLRWMRNKFKGKIMTKIVKECLEWADTGIVALILSFFIMTFIIQAFEIPSGSMRNTLVEGDHLFVTKFIYGTHIPFTEKVIWKIKKPKRGDIIVFKSPTDPKKDFIKRCIGLPGDKIEIRDKKVYVNDEYSNEYYTIYMDSHVYTYTKDDSFLSKNYRVRDNFGPIVVPEGYFFMMGDNRDSSYDSRFWGPLPSKYVKGKALFLYWPLKRIRLIK